MRSRSHVDIGGEVRKYRLHCIHEPGKFNSESFLLIFGALSDILNRLLYSITLPSYEENENNRHHLTRKRAGRYIGEPLKIRSECHPIQFLPRATGERTATEKDDRRAQRGMKDGFLLSRRHQGAGDPDMRSPYEAPIQEARPFRHVCGLSPDAG